MADFEIIFIYSHDEWIFTCSSEKKIEAKYHLKIFFDISGLPPLWVNNFTVFTHIFLDKVLINNDILRLHEILVTDMNFINKLHNLLIFLSFPEMESRIIIILKYVGDIANMLGLKGSGTLKALRI